MAAVTTGRTSQRTHLPILRVLSSIVVGKFKREPLLGGSLWVSELPTNIIHPTPYFYLQVVESFHALQTRMVWLRGRIVLFSIQDFTLPWCDTLSWRF